MAKRFTYAARVHGRHKLYRRLNPREKWCAMKNQMTGIGKVISSGVYRVVARLVVNGGADRRLLLAAAGFDVEGILNASQRTDSSLEPSDPGIELVAQEKQPVVSKDVGIDVQSSGEYLHTFNGGGKPSGGEHVDGDVREAGSALLVYAASTLCGLL